MYIHRFEKPDGDIASPSALTVPAGYDGTMLSLQEPPKPPLAEPPAAVAKEVKFSPKSIPEEETEEASVKPGIPGMPPFSLTNLLSVFGKLPFLDKLKGFFPRDGVGEEGKERKIGIEEMLLISVAAFLFFSKEGDRECALFLLLLLFL